MYCRRRLTAVRRPASPEEEEDAKRKDHLASNTETTTNRPDAGPTQHTTPKQNPAPGKQASSLKEVDRNSAIGTKVVCHVRGKAGSLKGVLKWVGYLPTLPKTKDNIVAGIELTKRDKLGTDGSFMGKRYFVAAPKHGYFVRYKDCKKIK